MDPLVLIGLFFGAGVLFMVLFVVVMVLTGKGKPTRHSSHAETGNKAADAMNTINNSNNF